MSTTAAVLSIVGAGLVGWFGGFVLGMWNWKPPRRLVRMRFHIRDYYTGATLFDDEPRLDPNAIYAPAAYQVERGEGTVRWIIDVDLREAE